VIQALIAFPARDSRVYNHSVARFDFLDISSRLFDLSHAFMPDDEWKSDLFAPDSPGGIILEV
jgi:hypothetical protein